MKSMRNNRGLTLLEITIALSLIAVLSVIMVSSTEFMTRLWVRINADNWASRDSVDSSLDKLFSSVLFEKGDNEQVLFHGTQRHIVFIAHTVTQPQASIYSLSRDKNNRLILVSMNELQQLDKQILIDNYQDNFSFYGQKNYQNQATWHDSWIDAQQMPELIKIEMLYPPLNYRLSAIYRVQTNVKISSIPLNTEAWNGFLNLVR